MKGYCVVVFESQLDLYVKNFLLNCALLFLQDKVTVTLMPLLINSLGIGLMTMEVFVYIPNRLSDADGICLTRADIYRWILIFLFLSTKTCLLHISLGMNFVLIACQARESRIP